MFVNLLLRCFATKELRVFLAENVYHVKYPETGEASYISYQGKGRIAATSCI